MTHTRLYHLLLAVYLLLAVGYGVVNPLFEAPDEHYHFFTAVWVAEHGRLPSVPQPAAVMPFVPQQPADWLGPEAAQPPLYYLLAAVLIAPFDTSRATAETIINPFVQLGDAAAGSNHNAFVQAPPTWPWPPHVWAAHFLRLISAVVGLGVLAAIYHSGRLLWPAHPTRTLLAMGVVACLPQFAFQFSAISNDVLITALASAALYQMVRLWPTGGVDHGRLHLLALICGTAALTKTQGILLIGWVLVGLIWLAIRPNQETQSPNRAPAGWGAAVLPLILHFLLPALALGLPLWVRNGVLYGDFTAANQFVLIAGGNRGFSVWESLAQWPSVWNSFFAVFGWFNVVAPAPLQWVWWAAVALAALGLLTQLSAPSPQPTALRTQHSELSTQNSALRNPPIFLALFLLGWVGLVTAALVAFNMQTPAAQGRLLFPALLPLALGMGWGLGAWGEKGARPRMALWLLVPLGASSLYGVAAVIPAAYARPMVGDESLIPATATRWDAPLGQGITLLAAEVDETAAFPTDLIPLTLYWRADAPPVIRPQLVVELFGVEQELLGKLQSWHGAGRYPADFWPVGQVVVEQTAVRVFPSAEEEEDGGGLDLPALAQMSVKLAGETANQTIAYVPIDAPESQGVAPVLAGWGGAELTAAGLSQTTAAPGETITIQLAWQVAAPLDGDYTVFVHMGEQGQAPLAQGDGVPRHGRWPTRLWQPAQSFIDDYTLTVPPGLAGGRYPIYIGFYRPEPPFARLPLQVGGGARPFDAYLVGEVDVVP